MPYDHDETRTRNLLIRSQTPYPLGHAVSGCQLLIKERIEYRHRVAMVEVGSSLSPGLGSQAR